MHELTDIQTIDTNSELGTAAITKALANDGFYRVDEVQFGDDPHEYVLDLGRQLGEVVPQFGKEVLELVPSHNAKANGPFGFGEFPLHTDGIFKKDELCPDLIIMLCIHPGEGGEHILVDAKAVVDALRSERRIGIDALLAQNIVFCHKGTETKAVPGTIVMPVAPPQEQAENLYSGPIYNGDDSRLRYSTTLMNRIGGDFEQVSESMEQRVFPISNVNKGTLWITDNKRMLHGRREILSADRKMLRVHVKEVV